MYRLFRLNDGYQFIGSFSELPTIGNVVRVSKYQESSESWTTGLVKEILDQTETKVVFKTKSSIYFWEKLS